MPQAVLFTNFARSTLASSISAGAVTLTVATSHGARFPSPTGGQYFYVVLENAALDREIVRVTGRTGDIFTVVRGVEGTTALAWNAGDIVSHRITAGGISDVLSAAGGHTIHVEDYGAVGGAADDTTAFQSALAAADALGGGTVVFSGNHRILSSLTVPVNTTLSGPLRSPGQLQPGDALADYENMGGVLRLSSAATITTLASAGVTNAIIVRDGLTLPFADHIAAATGVAAFSGTAVTIGGTDCRVQDLLILGFARAVDLSGFNRPRIIDVLGDCTNGVRLQTCSEAQVTRCQFRPFTTFGFSWTASDASQAILRRSGVAFEASTAGARSRFTDCMSYGYYRGFSLNSVNNTTIIGGCADETSSGGSTAHSGSIGVIVAGTSLDAKVIGVTVLYKDAGYWINQSATASAELVGCDAAACGSGIYIASGDLKVAGGDLRACTAGITVAGAASRVHGVAPRIRDSGAIPINFTAANPFVDLNRLDLPSSAAGATVVGGGTNWSIPAVASANPLNLPLNGDFFLIAGTTNFSTLNGGYRGREVTLLFVDVLTVTSGASMRLSGGANFTTANARTLTLVHNGVQWYEKARTV